MAIHKSRTQALKDVAAANAGKYLNDSHQVSGKLHFQQPVVQVGGAGTNLTPAGATGDAVILDEIPSGAAIAPGLCNVIGGALGGVSHRLYLTTDPNGASGDTAEYSPVGYVSRQNGDGSAPSFLVDTPGFVKPSNKRRYLFMQLGGALATGTSYFNIVGIRAE